MDELLLRLHNVYDDVTEHTISVSRGKWEKEAIEWVKLYHSEPLREGYSHADDTFQDFVTWLDWNDVQLASMAWMPAEDDDINADYRDVIEQYVRWVRRREDKR